MGLPRSNRVPWSPTMLLRQDRQIVVDRLAILQTDSPTKTNKEDHAASKSCQTLKKQYKTVTS
jgi:hypothetical protein